MSRIGKQPIPLPAGVSVQVTDHNAVTVKGPKGELKRSVDPDMQVMVEDGRLLVS